MGNNGIKKMLIIFIVIVMNRYIFLYIDIKIDIFFLLFFEKVLYSKYDISDFVFIFISVIRENIFLNILLSFKYLIFIYFKNIFCNIKDKINKELYEKIE